jgi:group I intron endonuclease
MEICNGDYCVYIHTNKINYKKYVGITHLPPNKRWRSGYGYRKHQYFWHAIQKYGWDNFEHEVIAHNLTIEEARKFETILIRELKTKNSKFGYNMTDGGEGARGYVWTDEGKQKLSMSHKGKRMSEESKKKLSESKKGHTTSEETKRKISEGNKGKTVTPEMRKYLSEALKKVNSSDEFIKKKSESMKGKQNNVRPVVQYSLDGKFIAEYGYMREAAKQTGFSLASIDRGCRTNKPVCGYLWEHKDKGGICYNG